ncbi:MAG TPA: phosphatase PAP2 family protein [Candidatus Paceibacterota bacterium]
MLDIQFFKFLNSLSGRSASGDQIIIFFATTFGILIVIAATFFLFWHLENKRGASPGSPIGLRPRENIWIGFRKKMREIALVLIVSAAAWGVSTLLKNLIDHPRPYAVLDGVNKLFSADDPYSFPSGHATFFSALATVIYFHHKRLGLWLALAALLIGFARVMAGIHFPSDVLTGFGLGILVAGLVAYLRKKV